MLKLQRGWLIASLRSPVVVRFLPYERLKINARSDTSCQSYLIAGEINFDENDKAYI
jgi:hypothetical protein